jgi:transcriptional regulator with XRE-family HTH domain
MDIMQTDTLAATDILPLIDVTPEDLRRRRIALGLSQAELGARLDVPQNTISRWEIGRLPIERPSMLDLALRALETEPRRRRRTPRPEPPADD